MIDTLVRNERIAQFNNKSLSDMEEELNNKKG